MQSNYSSFSWQLIHYQLCADYEQPRIILTGHAEVYYDFTCYVQNRRILEEMPVNDIQKLRPDTHSLERRKYEKLADARTSHVRIGIVEVDSGITAECILGAVVNLDLFESECDNSMRKIN